MRQMQGGGGGKGQRIVERGEASRTGELVKEILQEVKASGKGDNKNVLVELNIESTRHQEIQVIGNGQSKLRDVKYQLLQVALENT